MATAWVTGGQVVLRKPANPGYGVELSGGSQSDVLQVRAVGIGNPATRGGTATWKRYGVANSNACSRWSRNQEEISRSKAPVPWANTH